MRGYTYHLLGLLIFLSTTLSLQAQDNNETLSPAWNVAEIGEGQKPAFDFGADGRIHVMGMVEDFGGEVWYAAADTPDGSWDPQVVSIGYFYGPGDLRVDPAGAAHIVWHDHDTEDPRHVFIQPDGTVGQFFFDPTDSHDGWDNSLAIGPAGGVHMASGQALRRTKIAGIFEAVVGVDQLLYVFLPVRAGSGDRLIGFRNRLPLAGMDVGGF